MCAMKRLLRQSLVHTSFPASASVVGNDTQLPCTSASAEVFLFLTGFSDQMCLCLWPSHTCCPLSPSEWLFCEFADMQYAGITSNGRH